MGYSLPLVRRTSLKYTLLKLKGTLMRFEGKCRRGKRRKLQKLRRAWILHRSGFDDDTEGGEDREGWCRLLSGETPEPLIPGCTFSRRARVYENQPRTLSPAVSASRLNYTGSAYYPPLNYSPLTAKIAPCRHPSFPAPLSCVTRSSPQPHPRYIPRGYEMDDTLFFGKFILPLDDYPLRFQKKLYEIMW